MHILSANPVAKILFLWTAFVTHYSGIFFYNVSADVLKTKFSFFRLTHKINVRTTYFEKKGSNPLLKHSVIPKGSRTPYNLHYTKFRQEIFTVSIATQNKSLSPVSWKSRPLLMSFAKLHVFHDLCCYEHSVQITLVYGEMMLHVCAKSAETK